jgi:hypothetical protein
MDCFVAIAPRNDGRLSVRSPPPGAAPGIHHAPVRLSVVARAGTVFAATGSGWESLLSGEDAAAGAGPRLPIHTG